ncbi:hypothetical protein F5X68DRAFT_278379 [Plectosphaerella plurivora]|uniref:Small secreted protein n=1 Tax=Plectosphaerella plurivora TaxID=936078 RepID=A0A9P8V4S0_9PEZI|nr:hypothetical protein F5X68DRAFT_278379 [Plectosphaerella plurivora]
MKFSLVTLGFAALAVASPMAKRQNNIFSDQDYNSLSISGGVAGNGEQEALEKLGGLPADLSTVSKADITFLGRVNSVANEAEKGAFNPAIEAATGAEADALAAGKTKNKILKLTATMLKLQAQAAQGEDVAAKMADEQKKLDNNIAADKARAGEPSTALQFDANTAN